MNSITSVSLENEKSMPKRADVAEADAQGLEHADDHRGEEGAGYAAHAADHHHHEYVGQDGKVHGQHRRLARNLDRAAEAGEKGTEREYAGEQPCLVYAQRAGHFAVFGRRAHQRAPTRAREQQPQEAQHHRAERDQEQVVLRKQVAGDGHCAAHVRRARAEQVVRTPGPQGEVADDQHQGEGGEQLQQFRRAVQPPQQQALDQCAERAHDQPGQQHAAPEAEDAAAEGFHQAVGDVGAQHVEASHGRS